MNYSILLTYIKTDSSTTFMQQVDKEQYTEHYTKNHCPPLCTIGLTNITYNVKYNNTYSPIRYCRIHIKETRKSCTRR